MPNPSKIFFFLNEPDLFDKYCLHCLTAKNVLLSDVTSIRERFFFFFFFKNKIFWRHISVLQLMSYALIKSLLKPSEWSRLNTKNKTEMGERNLVVHTSQSCRTDQCFNFTVHCSFATKQTAQSDQSLEVANNQGYRHGFWGHCAVLFWHNHMPLLCGPSSWGSNLSWPVFLQWQQ